MGMTAGTLAFGYDKEDLKHLKKFLSMKDCKSRTVLKCGLSGANLGVIYLYGINLSGAILIGADLKEIDLKKADLSGANLKTTNLRRVDLSEADLRYANLNGVDLRIANLGEADLRYANLSEAKLDGTIINGAIFCNTVLPDGQRLFKDC